MLFGAVEELREAYDALQSAVFEAGRFVPPAGQLTEALDLLTTMQQIALGVAENVIACLSNQLDIIIWEKVVKLLVEGDRALESLINLATMDIEDSLERRLQRTLGFSAGEMSNGSGFTFPARLRVAWGKRIIELDSRLRQQLPHLLEPEQELSFDVRHHLTWLLVSTHVLPVHQAAMASRKLTLTALAADPARCSEVISGLVNEESAHYATHRQVQKGIVAFYGYSDPEDKMDPACDLYQRVLEGNIRRVAWRVLGMLGERLDSRVTLKTLEDRLSVHIEEPGCALLLSCINREWRNAIAHSNLHWDTVNQCISFDGDLVSPDDVAEAAILAFEVAKGFNAGVELALNESDKENYLQPPPTDLLAWDMWIANRLGENGVDLLSLRRVGKSIQLHVPPLSIETFRDHLMCVFSAQQGVSQIDTWEIKQPDRPDVVLKSRALKAAESLTEVDPHGNASFHPHAVEMILYADAAMNSGKSAQQAARGVLALSSAIILGEYRLFRQHPANNSEYIVDGMTTTISRQIRGIRKTATLLPKLSRGKLVTYSNNLHEQIRELRQNGVATLPRIVKFAHGTLIKGPAAFPWLDI